MTYYVFQDIHQVSGVGGRDVEMHSKDLSSHLDDDEFKKMDH